jgi:hypothetical protein
MDTVKVEPDSYEETSLATHCEANLICMKEEYVAEELFSSENAENVSYKALLYTHTHAQNIPFNISLSTAASSHRKPASARHPVTVSVLRSTIKGTSTMCDNVV